MLWPYTRGGGGVCPGRRSKRQRIATRAIDGGARCAPTPGVAWLIIKRLQNVTGCVIIISAKDASRNMRYNTHV